METIAISASAITTYPLKVPLVKQHLRLNHEEFDEILRDYYIPAAVEWAEGVLHRSIASRSHTWVLRDFPRTRTEAIRLPRGKTQSVSSIAYRSNNSVTTLTGPSSGSPVGSDYREDLRGDSGGILYPTYNGSWPDVDTEAPDPVVITFTAGWLATEVPKDILHGMMMYIADAMEVAGATDVPQRGLEVKSTLINGWRLERF